MFHTTCPTRAPGGNDARWATVYITAEHIAVAAERVAQAAVVAVVVEEEEE